METCSSRRRIYEILEVGELGDRTSRIVDLALMTLVAANGVAVVLESVASLHQAYGQAFHVFEAFSVAVFSVEYLLRVWSEAERSEGALGERGPWLRRLAYATSPLALVDLAAILPFFLTTFFTVDLRFLRLLRLLRILKFTRYSGALGTIGEVLHRERRSLGTAFFVLFIVLVFASSAIYLVEHRAQPQAFGSIPAAMWWAVATLTTVGYGDVTPMTVGGKLLASLVTIVGVGVVALPTSILASGFAGAHRRQRERLQAEANHALADGYLSPEEVRTYHELAERLGVGTTEAEEIVTLALRRHADRAMSACPHCGKEIASG